MQTGVQQSLGNYGSQPIYPSISGPISGSYSNLLPVIQTSSYDPVSNDQSILLTKVMDEEDRDGKDETFLDKIVLKNILENKMKFSLI